MNTPESIDVPESTAWPFVLAFGLTLVFAGFVTAPSISLLGVVLAVSGAVGWFREVLPVEAHDSELVVAEEIAIATSRERVHRIENVPPRTWLPVEIYAISAGVKGGLAGGAAMAVLAAAYGLLSGNGIWYPMNLLVAGFFRDMTGQIATFHLQQLLAAVPVHLLISFLVGLLYGAMLPMLPRNPILLGGFAAPLLWSGLIYGGLAFINPVMNQHINRFWFVLSQIGFGVVAGPVVARHERISTRPNAPLVIRMGIEAPGLVPEHREGWTK